MLEAVGLLILAAICCGLLIAGLVALPLMLIGGVLKLVFLVILLPLRLLAGVFGLLLGAFAVVGKLLLVLFACLFGLAFLAGGALLIPLLPLLALGLGIWLIARLLRPRQSWQPAP